MLPICAKMLQSVSFGSNGKPRTISTQSDTNIFTHSSQYRDASWHKKIKITVTAVNAMYQGNIIVSFFTNMPQDSQPCLDTNNTFLPKPLSLIIQHKQLNISVKTVHAFIIKQCNIHFKQKVITLEGKQQTGE
jgi:hypothetical protein